MSPASSQRFGLPTPPSHPSTVVLAAAKAIFLAVSSLAQSGARNLLTSSTSSPLVEAPLPDELLGSRYISFFPYRCARLFFFRPILAESFFRFRKQSHGVSRRPGARFDSQDKQCAMDRRDIYTFLSSESSSPYFTGRRYRRLFCELVVQPSLETARVIVDAVKRNSGPVDIKAPSVLIPIA